MTTGRSTPWVLATRNTGKLRELRALFATHGIEAIDLREAGVPEDSVAEDAVEAFETFEENALAKARYFSARLPGRIIVADDSGLAVDALGGEPGVRSKRWSGRADLHGAELDASNNALLLSRLGDSADRRARFVCAAAWSDGRQELVLRGEVHGHIVAQGRGMHGFGYDPHVFIDELGRTLAEATVAEKELVSHRGRAFVRLVEELRVRGMITA
ncbi:MAG: Nucleoside-triphosphatase rdgB [Gemmatimonadetes bacterium]|nr:Nucleoside-triphosphatase rdgB [Gemmatimonadota bacterium]